MNFHVVTLFPETIEAYTNASILGRAQKEGYLKVKTYQLRDFVKNPGRAGKWFYKRVDDKPYGGGPGMIIQAEPVIRAVEAIKKKTKKGSKVKVLITAAGGKPLTNAYAKALAKQQDVIIVCGRYEGIDSRAKKAITAAGAQVDEVSVGPYILTGGEVPALAIIDATARQIKGVLGTFESLEESRVASHEMYTRPEVLKVKNVNGVEKSYRVPKVLLSGHHAKID
ncbi:MAG TPA: tRNA (guanosine(37)-N1)-methyltransferase TrmD, partial [Candidatus Paceibacterota bacterium]|nr:tRNA (guanosine(37)-N1)-methyltransferase TrmD [Candidatus Paceibacterota bacterium]